SLPVLSSFTLFTRSKNSTCAASAARSAAAVASAAAACAFWTGVRSIAIVEALFRFVCGCHLLHDRHGLLAECVHRLNQLDNMRLQCFVIGAQLARALVHSVQKLLLVMAAHLFTVSACAGVSFFAIPLAMPLARYFVNRLASA